MVLNEPFIVAPSNTYLSSQKQHVINSWAAQRERDKWDAIMGSRKQQGHFSTPSNTTMYKWKQAPLQFKSTHCTKLPVLHTKSLPEINA